MRHSMGLGFWRWARSNRVIVHDRRQMPVGQGGFHVGALRALAQGIRPRFLLPSPLDRFRRAEVLYAYDCGSEPKKHVVREIRALAATQAKPHLNLLALSHFDRDHMCGLPELLSKRGFSVDTILMPFIDEDERIVALARAVAAAEDGGGRLEQFFVDLVLDPVATLGRFDPGRIVIVRGDDEDGPLPGGESPEPEPWGPGGRSEGTTKWRWQPGRPDRPLGVTTPVTQGSTPVTQVRNAALVASDPSWSVAWKFRPYVRPAAAADIATFRAAVETLFKWKPGEFATKSKLPAVRKQMVTTKRTALAKAYKAAFKDKNLTSLCLYSGPVDPDELDALAIEPRLPRSHLTRIGWLGTGDAHLTDAADIAAFRSAYAQDLDYASTFVLPHHGSIANTDPYNLVSQADTWVAAADPIHDWEHPHWFLKFVVALRGAAFRHVRSAPLTGFSETYVVSKPILPPGFPPGPPSPP